VRKPIGVAGIADSMGLPYETVRARVQRLIEDGVCVRVDGGLIVPQSVLDQPAAKRAMLTNVGYVRKLVRDLHAIGFDANPARGERLRVS
jgi:hypothetical protein